MSHYNIVIDSRSRTTESYPFPNMYVVDLPHVLKNITSVELVFALYEKANASLQDTYVNLKVDELQYNTLSNNNNLTQSFTQLVFTSSCAGPCTYDATMFRSIKYFDQPLSKLGRMTISFVSSDGIPFDISEHFLRFEVKCIKSDSPISKHNDGTIAQDVHTMSLKEGLILFDLQPNYTLPILITAFKKKSKLFNMLNTNASEREHAKNMFKILARAFGSLKQ